MSMFGTMKTAGGESRPPAGAYTAALLASQKREEAKATEAQTKDSTPETSEAPAEEAEEENPKD